MMEKLHRCGEVQRAFYHLKEAMRDERVQLYASLAIRILYLTHECMHSRIVCSTMDSVAFDFCERVVFLCHRTFFSPHLQLSRSWNAAINLCEQNLVEMSLYILFYDNGVLFANDIDGEETMTPDDFRDVKWKYLQFTEISLIVNYGEHDEAVSFYEAEECYKVLGKFCNEVTFTADSWDKKGAKYVAFDEALDSMKDLRFYALCMGGGGRGVTAQFIVHVLDRNRLKSFQISGACCSQELVTSLEEAMLDERLRYANLTYMFSSSNLKFSKRFFMDFFGILENTDAHGEDINLSFIIDFSPDEFAYFRPELKKKEDRAIFDHGITTWTFGTLKIQIRNNVCTILKEMSLMR